MKTFVRIYSPKEIFILLSKDTRELFHKNSCEELLLPPLYMFCCVLNHQNSIA